MSELSAGDIKSFLKLVEKKLADALQVAESVEPVPEQVRRMVAAAKKAGGASHLRQPEAAFLNTWLAPVLCEVLHGRGIEKPSSLLMAESHAQLRSFCSGTPARLRPFPFDKQWKVEPQAVFERWLGATDKAFSKPCPDFAIRNPFRVVIEGKYFRGGSLQAAKKGLVEGIYEALFYLGVPRSGSGAREWWYDYACLVAYDASEEQTLATAWNLIEPMHGQFWTDANLYVMVIGRTPADGMSIKSYEALFRSLGFTSFESHKKLQHPKLRITLYFNRNRAGDVSFAVYAKDADWFRPELWEQRAARQKKDEDPRLRTVVPRAGREREAFSDLLNR